MPVLSVIGVQWGDEGKGKIIDLMSRRADVVVRYQGGANAGHTVVVGGQKFVFHLLPSGVLHEGKMNVIGNGMVVDLGQLLSEVDELEARELSVRSRLLISSKAHLVMPYHKAIDLHTDGLRGGQKIGTTGRGIGPCYADKVSRNGLRVGDLFEPEYFEMRLRANIVEKNQLFEKVYNADPVDADAVLEEYRGYADRLGSMIVDTSEYLREAIDSGNYVFIEGAQGFLLDLDFGTYPFVTSSNSSALGIAAGTGIPPKRIGEIVGVAKAYCTRVGEGPFPTEDSGPDGQALQHKGGEFGATTGRPRRCGWFDGVAARHAVEICGLDSFALTKLDAMTGIKTIKVATKYRLDGKEIETCPTEARLLARCEPIYEELPGWDEDISGVRRDSDLPSRVKEYVRFIEDLLRIKAAILSVGPGREQTIFR